MPGYGNRQRKGQKIAQWGEDYELWRMDVRGMNMGLMGDMIERAVRNAITKHLLMDTKGKRLVVVLPSLIPHTLLSTVLRTLFTAFHSPGITLLSPPVLSTLVAGLRSGLVIDIGWRETVVTGIYDYREIQEKRSTRAMRMVTLEMARLLETHDTEQMKKVEKSLDVLGDEIEDRMVAVDLEQAEEVTTRMAWCRSRSQTIRVSSKSRDLPAQSSNTPIAEDGHKDRAKSSDFEEDTPVSIPSPSSPRLSIQLPFSVFASPAETALLGSSLPRHHFDDHDQPLHKLIYNSLLSLPPDVRAVCMSRIIFTGGGSKIPGLKARLLAELAALVEARGWDPVEGKAVDQMKRRLKEISGNRQSMNVKEVETKDSKASTARDRPDTNSSVPASLAPQVPDPIEDKIKREQNKGTKPTLSGVIRGVESLGAWAGASLLVSLRIKGVVEVERDSFLQHGLAGARKEGEVGAAGGTQKGVSRPSLGGPIGWTLGPWA